MHFLTRIITFCQFGLQRRDLRQGPPMVTE
jgi:hypothetical protein